MKNNKIYNSINNKLFKCIGSFIFSTIVGISISNVNATTFNFDINRGIDLYQVPYYYTDYVSVPKDYATTFQIKTDNSSAITYTNMEQERGYTVSSNGLVELKSYDSYFDSDPLRLKIIVENDPHLTSDNEEYITTVNIKDYAEVYCNKILDDYIANNISSSMTDYEIAKKACEFVCQYPYGYGSGSSTSLILYEYGDCFASCDTIKYILNKFGITCASHAAFVVGSSGSNHNNIAALLDGKLMMVEAGYNQKNTPRSYTIREISNNGYEVSSDVLKLYSGFDTILNVPSMYGAYGTGTIKQIGEGAFSYAPNDITSITLPSTIESIGKNAFENLDKLTYLNIPSSVNNINPTAFKGCISLKQIDMDSNNPYFTYENGIIYNKDKTIIVASLPGVISGNVVIPSSVKEIGNSAFSYNSNITGVTLSSSVEKIGADAFIYTNISGITIPSTIKEIGNYAFSTAKLSNVVIENGSTALIGNSAFTNNSQAIIYVPSTIESNVDDIASVAKSNYNKLMVEKNSPIHNAAVSKSAKYEIVNFNSKIELKDKLLILPTAKDSLIYEYTGSAICPEIKLQYGSYVLVEGKDYKVSHTNNIDVGTDTMTIEGIGNYTGKLTKKLEIEKQEVEVDVKYSEVVYLGDSYDIVLNSPVTTKTQSITYYDSNYKKLSKKPNTIGTYYFSAYATFGSNYSNFQNVYKYEIKEKPKYLLGDINEDGKINADDAANAIEIFKTNAQTTENIAKGDMDGNGTVNAEDSALIIEYFKTHH